MLEKPAKTKVMLTQLPIERRFLLSSSRRSVHFLPMGSDYRATRRQYSAPLLRIFRECPNGRSCSLGRVGTNKYSIAALPFGFLASPLV